MFKFFALFEKSMVARDLSYELLNTNKEYREKALEKIRNLFALVA